MGITPVATRFGLQFEMQVPRDQPVEPGSRLYEHLVGKAEQETKSALDIREYTPPEGDSEHRYFQVRSGPNRDSFRAMGSESQASEERDLHAYHARTRYETPEEILSPTDPFWSQHVAWNYNGGFTYHGAR